MATLYVAGPMTGYPRWNFDAFATASAALRAVGFTVVSPHEIDLERGFDPDSTRTFTREDYAAVLMDDLHIVAERVDGVATLPGWRRSRGATTEVALAHALGKPVAPFVQWIEEAEDDLWEVVRGVGEQS